MHEKGIDHMQTLDKAEESYTAMRDGRENLWPFCKPQAKIAIVRRNDGNQKNNGSNRGRRNRKSKHGNQSQDSKKKHWKYIPPPNNMKPIKQINGIDIYEQKKDGKAYQWCKKCNRWTTSHNTATHVNGQKSANSYDNRSNGNGNKNGNSNGGKRDTLVPTMNAAEVGWMNTGSRAFLMHDVIRPKPRYRNFKPQRSTKRFGARFGMKKTKRLHKREIARMTSIRPKTCHSRPCKKIPRSTSFREESTRGMSTLTVALSFALLLTTIGLNLNDYYKWVEMTTLGDASYNLISAGMSTLTWVTTTASNAVNWLSTVKCSSFLNTCGCFLSIMTWISTYVAAMSGTNYLRKHFPEDYLPEYVRCEKDESKG